MKRIAVITGASSGIGREFAVQLDALSAPGKVPADKKQLDEIWLVARRPDKLKETAALLQNTKAILIEADLGNPQGTAAVAAKLKTENPTISYFVNNAGFGSYGPMLENEKSRQLEMVDLNCRSVVDLSYTALAYMQRGSVLINVASLAAFQPSGNFAVYAASKAFVLSFSMSLGAEVEEKGILVNALCPGPVSSEFAFVASGGARKDVLGGKSADLVVARCLRDVRRKRWVSLAHFDWKFLAFFTRFVGKRFVARTTFKHMKRPQAAPAHVNGDR